MILKETLLLCNVCGDKTRYVGRDRNIYVFNKKKDVYNNTRKKPDLFNETSAMFVGTDKCKVSTHFKFAGTFMVRNNLLENVFWTLLTTKSIIDV